MERRPGRRLARPEHPTPGGAVDTVLELKQRAGLRACSVGVRGRLWRIAVSKGCPSAIERRVYAVRTTERAVHNCARLRV